MTYNTPAFVMLRNEASLFKCMIMLCWDASYLSMTGGCENELAEGGFCRRYYYLTLY